MRGARSFVRASQPVEEPAVNLTPLIDVVFVILIMFIVIAPLLEVDRINLANAPTTRTATLESLQESSLIAIYVEEDNQILMNGRSLSSKELLSALKEAKSRFPDVNPQIFHDRKAYFGTYQDVKNAAEMAGFSNVDIILKPS